MWVSCQQTAVKLGVGETDTIWESYFWLINLGLWNHIGKGVVPYHLPKNDFRRLEVRIVCPWNIMNANWLSMIWSIKPVSVLMPWQHLTVPTSVYSTRFYQTFCILGSNLSIGDTAVIIIGWSRLEYGNDLSKLVFPNNWS